MNNDAHVETEKGIEAFDQAMHKLLFLDSDGAKAANVQIAKDDYLVQAQNDVYHEEHHGEEEGVAVEAWQWTVPNSEQEVGDGENYESQDDPGEG